MGSADTPPLGAKSPPPDRSHAPPIGAGSIETVEADCEIIRESTLPKWYAEPPTGGFPQRVLPPMFPPMPPPTTSDRGAIVKTPRLATPVEARPTHRFIFLEEPTRTSSRKSPPAAERPNKRKRCGGLTKNDKLALITICTKHKADYKQGDKTGFWELVKKSMLAETGKDLAQPRSMVERWCNWEIDQVLERQTTDDQQGFRVAVKEFCAHWKEVRQEYNNRRQSKVNAAEETVQAWVGEPKEISDTSSRGDNNDLRFRSVLGEVKNSEHDIAAGRSRSVEHVNSRVLYGNVSNSHAAGIDTPASNVPNTEVPAGIPCNGSTHDSHACSGSFINDRARDCVSSVRSRLNSDAPTCRVPINQAPHGNTSSDSVPNGNVLKSNASVGNVVAGNNRTYNSPYLAQYRIGSTSNEPTSTTSANKFPSNNNVETAIASLPTPRASISGSQSSASSPITNMDFRHFSQARADKTRNMGSDAPQSSSRVVSSPIDNLAQAYVSRTYEASFDILREIMTRHDEIVRQISASKALLAADLEASKRHTQTVERELEDTRRLMNDEKAALKAQLDKSEAQNVASQQLIEQLQRQKIDATPKLQESYRESQQLQVGKESLEKQLDHNKRLSAEAHGRVEISESHSETNSKKIAAEKELETCQRQIVRIKNEKSVLELELSASKRQIQELKAHIPYSIAKPQDGTATLSPETA